MTDGVNFKSSLAQSALECRRAFVALTFRSARWGGQEDADLKVGATKAPQSGPPRRAALQGPPEWPRGSKKEFFKIERTKRECL
jgi:hypothetical protein